MEMLVAEMIVAVSARHVVAGVRYLGTVVRIWTVGEMRMWWV